MCPCSSIMEQQMLKWVSLKISSSWWVGSGNHEPGHRMLQWRTHHWKIKMTSGWFALAKALGRLHYRQYLRTLEDGFLFWIVCTVHQSEYLGCISWFGILTHLTIFSCLNLGQLCLSCRATLSWYCCVRQKVLSHFYSLGVSTCRTVTEFLRSWNVWSWLTVTLIG